MPLGLTDIKCADFACQFQSSNNTSLQRLFAIQPYDFIYDHIWWIFQQSESNIGCFSILGRCSNLSAQRGILRAVGLDSTLLSRISYCYSILCSVLIHEMITLPIVRTRRILLLLQHIFHDNR